MQLLLVQKHTLRTTNQAHSEATIDEYPDLLIANKVLSQLYSPEEPSAGSNMPCSLRKSLPLFGSQGSHLSKEGARHEETLSYYGKELTL